MKHFYLAFDPGATTGFATYDQQYGEFYSWQTEGRHAAERDAEGYFGYRTVVVGESFIITAETLKKSRQMDPLYIIGWADGECARLGIPFSLQTPSEGKAFGTDAKLKALGWWNPTKGGHANDAARHLLLRVMKDRALAPEMTEKMLAVIYED